ncbi:LPS export ABC transporter permease LptF [Undibacterium fentianense]|uniref:Lipopolysaccharide export system permease protein LptF n=1 Tax=Undibacterium fentianense TaxID=2828728 RepID=A0A941E496_9BURK|nr:LPS export ABC transporter permease LptF [Undibacterium fentianense]MBR7801246.1 LPS export ABC transporter permease LptF [Undibacterium fentianense]
MIFQRALRRELFSAASAVFTTLFTITVTFMLIRILRDAAGGKIASADVLILIGFYSLDYFPILLILTGFISVLLVVTRAYQDSEMVVWFASGLSLTSWVKPILSVALPLSIVVGTLSIVVSPWANEQMQEVRNRYEKREDIAKVAPGKFQELRGGRVSFVEEVSGDLTKVQNIFTSMYNDGRPSVIVAKEGKVEIDAHGDRFLVMSQGRRYDGLPTEGDFQMMQFEKYAVLLSTQSPLDTSNKSAKALPVQTLIDEPNPTRDGELLWRVSLPFMGLLLMLLAIPLGYVNPRVGRSANMIVALILVAVNLNILNMLQMAVVQGKLSFWRASWPMHLIVAILISLFFMWRLKVNSPWHPSTVWGHLKCRLYQKRGQQCVNHDLMVDK